MSAPRYIHANALVIGEAGVLLRGPSGSGKSLLTLDLIAKAKAKGKFARLVGDDRVCVEARHGRVIARPHPVTAGKMEIRGRGIVGVEFEPACVLRIVIDLMAPGDIPERLPEDPALTAELAGVVLPRRIQTAFTGAWASHILADIQQVTTI